MVPRSHKHTHQRHSKGQTASLRDSITTLGMQSPVLLARKHFFITATRKLPIIFPVDEGIRELQNRFESGLPDCPGAAQVIGQIPRRDAVGLKVDELLQPLVVGVDMAQAERARTAQLLDLRLRQPVRPGRPDAPMLGARAPGDFAVGDQAVGAEHRPSLDLSIYRRDDPGPALQHPVHHTVGPVHRRQHGDLLARQAGLHGPPAAVARHAVLGRVAAHPALEPLNDVRKNVSSASTTLFKLALSWTACTDSRRTRQR